MDSSHTPQSCNPSHPILQTNISAHLSPPGSQQAATRHNPQLINTALSVISFPPRLHSLNIPPHSRLGKDSPFRSHILTSFLGSKIATPAKDQNEVLSGSLSFGRRHGGPGEPRRQACDCDRLGDRDGDGDGLRHGATHLLWRHPLLHDAVDVERPQLHIHLDVHVNINVDAAAASATAAHD